MNSSLSLRTWIAAALAGAALGAQAQEAPHMQHAPEAQHDAQGQQHASQARHDAQVPDAHAPDETLDLARMTEIDIEAGDEVVTPVDPSNLRQVNRIPIHTRLHSWTAIDDDTLIVWASASKPYLIELARPVQQLTHTTRLGVTSRGREVRAGFDSVEIDGFRYPIAEIYQLTRDDAETLQKDENFTGVF